MRARARPVETRLSFKWNMTTGSGAGAVLSHKNTSSFIASIARPPTDALAIAAADTEEPKVTEPEGRYWQLSHGLPKAPGERQKSIETYVRVYVWTRRRPPLEKLARTNGRMANGCGERASSFSQRCLATLWQVGTADKRNGEQQVIWRKRLRKTYETKPPGEMRHRRGYCGWLAFVYIHIYIIY